jgi:6-phosphofructokinase 1
MLTGGGDCPGLNAVVRGATRTALAAGWEVVGLKNGWRGLVKGETIPLTLESVSGILHRGGTILGSSRTNPYKNSEDAKAAVANFRALRLDALIAIGGEDTLGVGVKLIAEGLPVIGVPKTIDNDLSRTDYTFGFDTAVNIAMEAIDRLHTTAESHHRIIVVEVMGRHAGWIATSAGLAGGADVILIPEEPIDLMEVVGIIKKRHGRGKEFSIVVVSEGAIFKDAALQQAFEDENLRRNPNKKRDAFGHIQLGGIGDFLSLKIEQATGFETRATVLGHIQRGGSPTAFDRILGTRFGVRAMELVLAGQFGRMVSLQGTQIVDAPLDAQAVTMKKVDPELFRIAKVFFG